MLAHRVHAVHQGLHALHVHGIFHHAILLQARSDDDSIGVLQKRGCIFGAAAAAGPYAMVEIYRPGADSERFIDAPSEIAARILPFTVTDDVKPAGSIDSKFGAVSLVDFAIWR